MFTQDELMFIARIVSQVQFKAGQSNELIMAESIVEKCQSSVIGNGDKQEKELKGN